MTEFSNDATAAFGEDVELFEIRAAMHAICASDDFRRSGRLTDLLRYIVTEESEGRGQRLKAYSIATEVLGRKADFDPSSDSIVRVEMARLRIALKLYYAAAEEAAVVIDVPKGRYRPTFTRSAGPAPEPLALRNAEPVGPPPPDRERADAGAAIIAGNRRTASALVACVVGILLMMAGIGGYILLAQPKDAGERLPPLVLVAPVRIMGPDAVGNALGLTLQSVLVSEIASDPLLAVGFLSDERQDLAAGARKNRAVYLLAMTIASDGDRWSVSANLQDGRAKTVVWSRSEKVIAANVDGLSWAYGLSRQFASMIGDPFGVVVRGELSSSSEGLPASRQCLILLRQAKATWTEVSIRRFTDCAGRLQNSLETENALALALMARGNYGAVRWLAEPDRATRLELASQQIAKAQAIEPQLDLVETTAIRIAACRNDASAVERMLRAYVGRRMSSPQALFEAAYLSAFLLGDPATSERFSEQGRRLAVDLQPTEFLPPALLAFRSGDMTEVTNLLKRAVDHSHPVKNVLWLAASGALRDEAAFRSALTRLADSGYRTPESILGIVSNSCWNQQVKTDIDTALRTVLDAGFGRTH